MVDLPIVKYQSCGKGSARRSKLLDLTDRDGSPQLFLSTTHELRPLILNLMSTYRYLPLFFLRVAH
jgi:hypothetical protein